MALFCDVAVPVPLDATFTYRLPEDAPEPCIGGRVIVPFREKRLCGVVTELHDREPKFQTRRLSQVLDSAPALTPELMQLGRWIAQYYIAPIGEVYRTMLPLSAEFRRVVGYHITDKGIAALHAASAVGSSLRSHKEPEHQMLEYAALNRLADGEVVREATLRTASGATQICAANLAAKEVDCPRRPQRRPRRQPHRAVRDVESRPKASSTPTSRKSWTTCVPRRTSARRWKLFAN